MSNRQVDIPLKRNERPERKTETKDGPLKLHHRERKGYKPRCQYHEPITKSICQSLTLLLQINTLVRNRPKMIRYNAEKSVQGTASQSECQFRTCDTDRSPGTLLFGTQAREERLPCARRALWGPTEIDARGRPETPPNIMGTAPGWAMVR